VCARAREREREKERCGEGERERERARTEGDKQAGRTSKHATCRGRFDGPRDFRAFAATPPTPWCHMPALIGVDIRWFSPDLRDMRRLARQREIRNAEYFRS
jgi:hypothetical protein